MEAKAFVKNAADPEQVKSAERKENNLRATELSDLKWVLGARQGRRFLWRMLSELGAEQLPYGRKDRDTYFKLGMLNAAHFLKSEIIEASEEAWLFMQQEEFKEKRKDRTDE